MGGPLAVFLFWRAPASGLLDGCPLAGDIWQRVTREERILLLFTYSAHSGAGTARPVRRLVREQGGEPGHGVRAVQNVG
jgi:hypothetical protein